jgi:hypothetical protein
MEAICSSETPGDTQRTIRRYILDDGTFHNYRCENLKSWFYFMRWEDKIRNPAVVGPLDLGSSGQGIITLSCQMKDETSRFQNQFCFKNLDEETISKISVKIRSMKWSESIWNSLSGRSDQEKYKKQKKSAFILKREIDYALSCLASSTTTFRTHVHYIALLKLCSRKCIPWRFATASKPDSNVIKRR